jgi:hypothetical protein
MSSRVYRWICTATMAVSACGAAVGAVRCLGPVEFVRALEPLGRTPLFLGTTGTVGVYAFVQSLPGGRDPLSFRPLTADGWTFALTLAVLCGSLAAFPLAPGRGLDALLSAPLTLVAVFFCVDRNRRVQRAYADAVSGG